MENIWKIFRAASRGNPQKDSTGGNQSLFFSFKYFPKNIYGKYSGLPPEAIPKRILKIFYKYFHKNIYGKCSGLLPKETLKGNLK